MKAIKFVIMVLALGVFSCECDDDVPDGCVDPSKKTEIACYEVFSPVCGCNGVTYPNVCYARSAGVVRWTEGRCN